MIIAMCTFASGFPHGTKESKSIIALEKGGGIVCETITVHETKRLGLTIILPWSREKLTLSSLWGKQFDFLQSLSDDSYCCPINNGAQIVNALLTTT